VDWNGATFSVGRTIQTMIDVVMNEPPLGLVDGLLDRMKLLSEFNAAAAFLEHFYDPSHVALGTLEPCDDRWMRFVNVFLCHRPSLSYPGGSNKSYPGGYEALVQTIFLSLL
jgi:hypothetical protein